MIDYLLVATSSISLFMFVIGLIICVRTKGQAEILLSMKGLFIGLLVLGCISLWYMVGDMRVSDKVVVIFLYILLFWAMSFSYILGLFGMPLTSTRVQFLLTLMAHGGKGADIQNLTKDYSRDSIIGIRLHRLITSGEIIQKGNKYMLKSRWTYFVLHNEFLLFLIELFQPLDPK